MLAWEEWGQTDNTKAQEEPGQPHKQQEWEIKEGRTVLNIAIIPSPLHKLPVFVYVLLYISLRVSHVQNVCVLGKQI